MKIFLTHPYVFCLIFLGYFLPTTALGNSHLSNSELTKSVDFNCNIDDLTLNCSDNFPPLIVSWLDEATFTLRNELGNDWLINNDYDGIAPVAVCFGDNIGKQVTFTATNSNGNTQICTAVITIIDDEVVIENCPTTDLVLSTSDDIDVAIAAWLQSQVGLVQTAVTNAEGCDPSGQITITNDYSGIPPTAICRVNDGGLTITFTATDECENTATCHSQIIILDNEPPVLDCSNLRNSTACTFPIRSWLGIPTATDNQTPSDQISITYEDDESDVAPCFISGTILRTWTATDNCGNIATCGQSIRISEFELVSGCNISPNNVVRCELGENLRQKLIDWDEGIKNFLARCANNSCRNPVTVTSTFDPDLIPMECISISERWVSYTVRDECGRTASKRTSFSVIKTTDPICDNIELETENNQLIINNLVQPNTHVKVLDKDYGIIYECIGDCGETVVVPSLNTGELYRTHIQVYDGNWQLVCDDFQEVRMKGGSAPCDTSVCQGDVFLTNQSAVDAFCGCEIIEGHLRIGDATGFTLDSYKVVNLEKLHTLKKVKGDLNIERTNLTNFNGLNQLKAVENRFNVILNPKLKNYEGLENLESVNYFSSSYNAQLENFEGLDKLKNIKDELYINENQQLSSLIGFEGINTLKNVQVSDCDNLQSLEGFKNLKIVEENFFIRDNFFLTEILGLNQLEKVGDQFWFYRNHNLRIIDNLDSFKEVGENLIVQENDSLKDISGFTNLEKVLNLGISKNPVLEDCCSISHLIDSDPNNGQVLNNFKIAENKMFCGSAKEILDNCENQPTPCETVTINTSNNRILLTNLGIPNQIIKVFDEEYNILYECVSNCQEKQSLVPPYPNGTYIVDIQFYNENWENICLAKRTVTLENENPCGNNPCETIPPVLANIPADMTVVCDAVPAAPTNVTATDNCDDSVEITVEERRIDGSCIDNYTYTRTWVARDDCGNSATGLQTITVMDSIAPLLVNIPTDITVSDISQLPNDPSLFVTATDNCDADVVINFNEENVSETTTIRTWTAVDNCGNSTFGVQTITISEEVEVLFCEDITLESADNQLTINLLDAPNTLVKVFDDNWQLVFQCSENCDETLIFEDLNIGDIYRLDVQFYNENWQLICSKKMEKLIGSDTRPCPSPICQQNIQLTNQAEVDAFCGCEVIDGVVTIGGSGDLKDINDLSNLSDLREIKGGLTILNTSLQNLNGLEGLEKVSSISVALNPNLTSLEGIDNLQVIENGIFLRSCPILTDITALSNVQTIRFLDITETAINNLQALSNINKDFIKIVFLKDNHRLTSLSGLEDLRVITTNPAGNLSIINNDNLTDISALENIGIVEGSLFITDNRKLSDCCSITNLIDGEVNTGYVIGNITIRDNRFPCRFPTEIVEECSNDPTLACEKIAVNWQANKLTISGINVPNPIVKLFDKDYQMVFDCVGECDETLTFDFLTATEIYYLDIQFYDRNWNSLCSLNQTIDPNAENRSTTSQSIDFSIFPNPAQSEVLVNLSRLRGEKVALKLQNQFGQIVLEKSIEQVANLPEKLDVSQLDNGLYFLQIQGKGKRIVSKKLLVSRLY